MRMRTILATGGTLLTAAIATAQSQPAPGEGQSLGALLWSGMEWPAYFILGGSLAALALIGEHFITLRRTTIMPPDQLSRARQLIERRAFRECFDLLKGSSTFFAQTMSAALMHARHGFDAMQNAATEKAGELSGRMFRKVEYLNILGNLGPLMGLLGTVWGMIIAFGELGEGGGEAGAGELARGISLALVNTLLGLALAIVGMGFFGLCRNRVDALSTEATVKVRDMLEYFRPAIGAEARRPARAEPAPAAPAQP